MIRTAIVEDEIIASEYLEKYLRKYCEEMSETLEVKIYNDPLEFLRNYHADLDIIFMDIEMPRMNGFEVSEKIREKDESVLLIFVTNMKKLAIRGYEVNAFDFIVKPINYYSFRLTLKKALKHIEKHRQHLLTIPIRFGECRIDINEVRYVETLSRKLVFHLGDEKVESTGTLKSLEQALYDQGFRRCNNCLSGEYELCDTDL